ncbi:UTRA domain-containing protein [Zavarzinia compransoris]|uniref:UTRA domain-containing protein n=1 Tax=Zavarzinia marina TaxID=2911065 RepID=UPI001F25AD32|nr:UTRA domain-containing protein [Zavarzinia marina]MCF4167305.1 UTRA domain-containing protein [Zavarzinia marina]
MNQPLPHYQRLKAFVTGEIEAGRLRPGDRIPSELDLIKRFGVSRMTANRALRELEQAGAVTRVQGVGSFVASRKTEQAMFEINNIAEAVRAGGQAYGCRVIRLAAEADPAMAAFMGLAPGERYGRAVLLHLADGVPVQHEDRCANLAFAPDFLTQDFTRVTPYDHLMSLGPLQAAEQVFEADLPGADLARLLQVTASLPCIVLRRRTWSLNMVASAARITAPSSRYRFSGVTGTVPPAGLGLPRL